MFLVFRPLFTHEIRALLTSPIVRAFPHRFRFGLSVVSTFRLSSASLASPTSWPTMPSADFCPAFGSPLDFLSRVTATTGQTSWGNSSRLPRAIAASTLPLFDEYGLRSTGLARPALAPPIRFLFIDSRFCSALLSDPPSPERPCASLTLHLHQVGWKTFTSKLLDMPSTPCRAEIPLGFSSLFRRFFPIRNH